MTLPCNRNGRGWWVAVLLLALPLRIGPLAAQSVAGARVAQLDSFIRRGMADWDIPGLSVVVVHRDSVVFQRGYGVRRRGEADAVDPQTMFGMMSTTKALTALAVAMLVDEGRLRWNDPVSRHLPEFALSDP